MNLEHSERVDDSPLIAAIDLGSNSFHLIIARLDHGELRPIERMGEKVQLAAGLDQDDYLTEEAMERGLACLRKLAQYCADIPGDCIRVVGTNALRKARNGQIFVHRAQEILGHPIDIIAGREEARLIYLGVAHTQSDDHGRQLVVDIGGGSTEFIIGERFEPQLLESLHMGCITWSQQYFRDGRLTASQFDEAYYGARLELLHIERSFRQLGWDHATGSSGSIKSISTILAQRGEETITRKGLESLKDELLQFKKVNRINFPGLKPERLTIFPGGLAILCALFDSLKITSMGFSDGALREGLLYNMIGRKDHEDVRQRTLLAMQKRYHVNTEFADRALENLDILLKVAQPAWHLSETDCQLVRSAAMVHQVGMDISHTQFHRHGAYILSHADLLGFTKRQQRDLSILVRGHRRSLPLQSLFQLPHGESERLLQLMIVLRLAILLGRARFDQSLSYTFVVDDHSITFTLPEGWLEANPLTAADFEHESAYLTRAGYHLKLV